MSKELLTVAKQYRYFGEEQWRPYAPLFEDEPRETRDLVTREQALSIIATEIKRERDIAEKQLSDVVNRMTDDYNQVLARAKAAEDELAKMKRQNVVGYVRFYDSGCLSNISETPINGYVPIYTEPGLKCDNSLNREKLIGKVR